MDETVTLSKKNCCITSIMQIIADWNLGSIMYLQNLASNICQGLFGGPRNPCSIFVLCLESLFPLTEVHYNMNHELGVHCLLSNVLLQIIIAFAVHIITAHG